ncbi:MAG TPA: hypothetical protein VMV69_07795 [Pirellulales bacterium]|nr:hypothetical protein [Pirellulales bacterium]
MSSRRFVPPGQPCKAPLGPCRRAALAVALSCISPMMALGEEAAKEKVDKPAATVSAAAPGAASAGAKSEAVSLADVLSFRQEKVAAEMTELEERMFRLSEALKALEPENSSRLMLGLKFAREELILHQMKEAQKYLAKMSLDEAAAEEKVLLGKLQRLHDLLLSTDLDFQMQLEKLRAIREILRQLDKAIQEEDRERGLSRETADKEKEFEGLRKKRATLDELIQREEGHIEQGGKLADVKELSTSDQEAVGKLAEEQAGTRTATQVLAQEQAKAGKESPKESSNLGEAEGKMGQAGEKLEKKEASAALPDQKEALAALEREREATDEQMRKLAKELAEADFNRMKRDQNQNRKLNEGITSMVRDLGETGAGALGELVRADGSMGNAENQLGDRDAESASGQQKEAEDSLKYAKQQLEEEAEKLLDQLRAEVKRRVLEGLTLMLERQIAVRESTQLLGPKAAAGSRNALTSLVGLAKSEGRIVEVANELITLVEETEFGIALPAALLVVRDAMSDVQVMLADGDGSQPVVEDERQIEADLESLLAAMKQMPSSKMSNRKGQKGQRNRERELNRLIAELKLIRLLQVRTNRRTVDVDKARPAVDADALSAGIKRRIEELADQQDQVRDATQRLSEERGEELQGVMP